MAPSLSSTNKMRRFLLLVAHLGAVSGMIVLPFCVSKSSDSVDANVDPDQPERQIIWQQAAQAQQRPMPQGGMFQGAGNGAGGAGGGAQQRGSGARALPQWITRMPRDAARRVASNHRSAPVGRANPLTSVVDFTPGPDGAGQMIGKGTFAEVHAGRLKGMMTSMISSIHPNGGGSNIVAVKRFPYPHSPAFRARQKDKAGSHSRYTTWRDYLHGDQRLIIDHAREECEWAKRLQEAAKRKTAAGGSDMSGHFPHCLQTNIGNFELHPQGKSMLGDVEADWREKGDFRIHHLAPVPKDVDDDLYLVLEYKGARLLDFLRRLYSQPRAPSSPPRGQLVVKILRQLVRIVAFLREDVGAVHHDLKADNLVFDEVAQKVVLIDFGSMTSANMEMRMQPAMGNQITGPSAPIAIDRDDIVAVSTQTSTALEATAAYGAHAIAFANREADAWTPGFAPKEKEEGTERELMAAWPSIDFFALGTVIGEILLDGRNIITQHYLLPAGRRGGIAVCCGKQPREVRRAPQFGLPPNFDIDGDVSNVVDFSGGTFGGAGADPEAVPIRDVARGRDKSWNGAAQPGLRAQMKREARCGGDCSALFCPPPDDADCQSNYRIDWDRLEQDFGGGSGSCCPSGGPACCSGAGSSSSTQAARGYQSPAFVQTAYLEPFLSQLRANNTRSFLEQGFFAQCCGAGNNALRGSPILLASFSQFVPEPWLRGFLRTWQRLFLPHVQRSDAFATLAQDIFGPQRVHPDGSIQMVRPSSSSSHLEAPQERIDRRVVLPVGLAFDRASGQVVPHPELKEGQVVGIVDGQHFVDPEGVGLLRTPFRRSESAN
ncbi:unnamed protein product [Amoebophrya sp. A25]|nr:unnamed protein product [Amoebophrya sp. A25]|eukprot:GSA25T00022720001.1